MEYFTISIKYSLIINLAFLSITAWTKYVVTISYDKISAAIDNNEFFLCVFIFLSRAFDTVDHQVLLDDGWDGYNKFANYSYNRQ